jgi:DNA polymerase-3 subunit beta
MKIEMNAGELHRGLKMVRGLIAGRVSLPVLSAVALRAEEGALVMVGTNLEQSVSVRMPAVSVTAPGRAVVSAGLLDAYASTLSGVVEMETSGPRMELRSGSAKVKLLTFEVGDFPDVEFGKAGREEVLLPMGALPDLLRVSFTQSRDETRYALNGVHLELRKNLIIGVATDGRRLTRADVELPAFDGGRHVTVPRPAVEWLLRNGMGGAETMMAVSDTSVEFTSAGVVFASKLIEGPYPNWRQVVPEREDAPQSINPLDWMMRLRRVALICDRNNVGVTVAVSGNRVVISAETPEVGTARDEGDLFTDAHGVLDTTFSVNASMLGEALDVLHSTARTKRVTWCARPSWFRQTRQSD